MLPAKPNILKCPHCGGLRRQSALLSRNTFGAKQWSDAKREFPMLSYTSRVMRCPHCQRYHFYNSNHIVGECETYGQSSFGNLSYASLKEALAQLHPTGDNELDLRIMLVHAYNDLYGGCPGTRKPSEAPAEERLFFEQNVRRVIQMHSENRLFCAELYREIGEFDQALAILRDISGDDNTRYIAQLMAERAEQCDPCVFVLKQDCSGVLRHAQNDDPVFVYDPKMDVEVSEQRPSLWERIKQAILHDDDEQEFCD